MKKSVLVLLFGIFIFTYVLRVWFLPQNILTFGYDQARDAVISQQILNGDFKIQGPPASTPGLYHGVFYYYLLAPAYLLGNGSPIIAAYWIALINALTVFIVFCLTYLMTKKISSSLIASVLFAVSFESVQYATWLSNPTTAVLTIPLMYLGLWLWLKEKKGYGPLLAGLGLGLSVQAEIFLAYHIVPLAIWLLASKKSIIKNQFIVFIAVFLISISSMIVSQFKFGLTGLEGLKTLAGGTGGSLAYAKSLGDYLILYLNQIGRIYAFNSYPGNIGLGGGFVLALVLVSIFRAKHFELTPKLLLASWLLSHLSVVSFGGTSTPFLMVGIGPAVSILIALYLSEWKDKGFRSLAAMILAIIIAGNLSMALRENKSGSTLFAIQKDMLLTKELSAIDYTYQKAEGKPFSVNSLTSPLYINIVWAYLYEWYGEPKYGYLPSWHGRDQVGQLTLLPGVDKPDAKSFLILEPMGGIPSQYLDLTIGEEDSKTELVDEKLFGELRIQERRKLE